MPRKTISFEYNAPQYLDFTKGIPEDVDDSYFELAPEHPAELTEPEKAPQEPIEAEKKPQQSTVAQTDPQEPTEATNNDPQTPTQTSSKPQTGADQPDTTMEVPQAEGGTEETLAGEGKPEGATGGIEGKPEGATGGVAMPGSTSKGRKGARRRSLSVGVRHSPRLLAISKALRRSNAARRSSGSQPIPATAAATTATSSRAKGSLVTKIHAPKKGNQQRVSGLTTLTTEDKEELNQVATFRQKISVNNKKRKEGSMAPPAPLKPTKPQEFTFATDQRLRSGNSGGDGGGGDTGPVEFARMLRSSSTSSVNSDTHAPPKGPTIPQPFKFTTTTRTTTTGSTTNLAEGGGGEGKKFVSMAELNMRFVLDTPERFRTKRATSVESQEGDSKSKKPRGVTMPHTPQLATTTRSRRRRSLTAMTQEEREMMEYEEEQKHAFKARPINKNVFKTPPTGYHVERKLPTVPEPFNITQSKKDPPLKMSESLLDVSNASLVSTLPYSGMPFNGKRTNTHLQPFSFDQRDKEMMSRKQKKIQKFLEEEKRLAEFHARPMPMFDDGVHGVPPKKPPTPTQPKPFSMRVDQRGSVKQEKFKQQLEKEAQFETEKRRFHAQDDGVVHRDPFIPEKSKKPLTEISNFTLNTEVRAGERSEYELQQKAVEEEMLAAKKREEERRAAEELAEIARLRQEVVHKAKPVPRYKPMVIHSSLQPPTVPESPKFATNSRLRSRSRANSTFSVNSE